MEDGAAKERRLPSVKGRGCCRLWWRRRWLDPVALLDSPLLLHCSFFFSSLCFCFILSSSFFFFSPPPPLGFPSRLFFLSIPLFSFFSLRPLFFSSFLCSVFLSLFLSSSLFFSILSLPFFSLVPLVSFLPCVYRQYRGEKETNYPSPVNGTRVGWPGRPLCSRPYTT
jgi:hypothetical protein